MIDYQKLKLVHELADKCNMQIWFTASCQNGNGATAIMNLDDLIAKLEELTQPNEPQPKYKVGQEIYLLGENSYLLGATIESIFYDVDGFEYILNFNIGSDYRHRREMYLYPTKQALIEAQLRYWSDLAYKERSKPIDEECDHEKLTVGCSVCDTYKVNPNAPVYFTEGCRHEPNDNVYLDLVSREQQFKCKKCGEYYK